MARIGENAFRQYRDGQDRLTAPEYMAERELIRLAVNDLDDKIQRTEGIREEFSNTVNEVETVKGEVVQTKQDVETRIGEFSQTIDQTTQELQNKASKSEVEEVSSQLAGIAINVRQFGAVGDGVTDDLNAIQNAIDYAESNGFGTVLLNDGTFIISNRLNVSSNLTIKGNNATIKLKDNRPLVIDGVTNWEGGTLLSLENVENVAILDLNLDGNKANQQTTTNGIFNIVDCIGVKQVTIKGCIIHDAANGGIKVTANDLTNYPLSQDSLGATHLTVTGNTFYNLQQSIQITESDSSHIVFSGNDVTNTTSHGMSVYPGTRYISVIENKMKDIGMDEVNSNGAGIRLLEVEDAIVSNNIIENAHKHGIYINTVTPVLYKTSNRVTINNNIVKGGSRLGSQGCGIAVNGTNVTISGNNVFDIVTSPSNSVAIQLIGDYSTVTGNLINNTYTGINVNGNNISVSNNSIVDAITYGIIVGSSNLSTGTVTGNSVLGKKQATVVGIRIQSNSNGTVLSGNRVSGATNSYQDTGIGTKGISSYGVATIPANDSGIYVGHGLGRIPTYINITPQGNIGACWVANITTAGFSIFSPSKLATATAVSWRAEI